MELPPGLLEPIPGESPAGENLRYEPVYQEIKKAREEEDEIPQGAWKRERKTADWGKVVKLATEALSTRSKDLQVAAWLTEAWVHRGGLQGLASGLDLLRELLERFWEGLWPEIEDDDLEFRAVPLEWVALYLHEAVRSVPLNGRGHDHVAYAESRRIPSESEAESGSQQEVRQQAIADGKVLPEDFEEAFAATPKSFYKELSAGLEASRESLEALESLSDEKFGPAAPSFRELRETLDEVGRVVRQLLERKLEVDPDPLEPVAPEPVPAEPGKGASAAGAAAAAGPPPSGASGGAGAAAGASQGATAPVGSTEIRSREDAAARVAAAAHWMRRQRPGDPAPFLMLRGLRWGELRAGGPAVDPRLLAAPPTQERTRLKSLLLDGRWADLLEACEELMSTSYGRGWLDLQRYVLRACEELGSDFDAVAGAIRGALGSLIQDLPELPDLTLMDDSPTANAETRAWLGELLGDVVAAPTEGARPRHRTGGVDASERARKLVRDGEPRKAIELLMAEARQEDSERARFLRRSEAAEIMVGSGLENVAMPILQELLQQVEDHRLEEWEAGETVARPLGLLYRCTQTVGDPTGTAEELYLRVCRLDPMQAITFRSGSGDGDAGA